MSVCSNGKPRRKRSCSLPARGIDRYLGVMPFLSAGLAAVVWCFAARRTAILCAAPILLLWAVANPVTAWLNRPPREKRRLEPVDIDFLLVHALRIWRYFSEFGTERHNYLVPDNVEEEGLFEASRISPTNIGMLLNTRGQAACELGFITTPDLQLLPATLCDNSTPQKVPRAPLQLVRYATLQPLGSYPSNAPFVSTVDSGKMSPRSLPSMPGYTACKETSAPTAVVYWFACPLALDAQRKPFTQFCCTAASARTI